MILAIAALLAFAVLVQPARADVRALAPASAGAGPAVSGDRVLWGSPRVYAAPLAGGPAVVFGRVPARSGTLSYAAGVTAFAGDGALWTSGADGAFTRVSSSLGDPQPFPVVPFVQATTAGVLAGDSLFSGGRRSLVAVPPGAEYVAAGGGLGVAAVPDGVLVVFDLVTGIEQRQISLGDFDPVNLSGLGISAEGDVAATVPLGDGGDALVWAPAGAERVRVLARGRGFGQVAVAGGRIAYARGLQDGVQPVVVDGASGRVLMRGPAGLDVFGLSFDGRALAWSTPSCLLVATSSSRTIPTGPCSRTVVAVDRLVRGVRVACINAPGASCRARVGGKRVRVARGRARTFR